jgi:hypothetical protein
MLTGQERSGMAGRREVRTVTRRLGVAVKVRCCRYGIGAYWLDTAGSLHWCGEVW